MTEPNLEHFDQQAYDQEMSEAMQLPTSQEDLMDEIAHIEPTDTIEYDPETIEAYLQTIASPSGREQIFPRIEVWHGVALVNIKSYTLLTTDADGQLQVNTLARFMASTPTFLAAGKVSEYVDEAIDYLTDAVDKHNFMWTDMVELVSQEQVCCFDCGEPIRKASEQPFFWEEEDKPLCPGCHTDFVNGE